MSIIKFPYFVTYGPSVDVDSNVIGLLTYALCVCSWQGTSLSEETLREKAGYMSMVPLGGGGSSAKSPVVTVTGFWQEEVGALFFFLASRVVVVVVLFFLIS